MGERANRPSLQADTTRSPRRAFLSLEVLARGGDNFAIATGQN